MGGSKQYNREQKKRLERQFKLASTRVTFTVHILMESSARTNLL